MDKLRVLDILPGTIVDGPGLRTSIYLAGCGHQCPGCHNPESWAFDGGKEMNVAEIIDAIEESGFNVTLSGGDPLYQIDAVVPLCNAIRSRGYTIWLYTGYTYEEIIASDKLMKILPCIDVLVEGPFVQSLRDISLRFRGSSNQRIIDAHASNGNSIVLWKD